MTAETQFESNGQTAGGTVTVSVTPEPDALTLACSALAMMLAMWASRPRSAMARMVK
jgi:hypothetical protein